MPAPTTLPADNNLDIFYYDYAGRSSVLRRLTSTPYADETMPMQYDSTNIAYLSDENGIVNRYTAHLDSAIAYVDTVEHYRMIVDNFAQTDIQVAPGPAGRLITCRVEPDRVYRIEFTDDALDAAPVWHDFAANGTWTNTTAATSCTFTDDGSPETSGTPLTARRAYRVWVGLP